MKVVLDTNVVLAALIKPGGLSALLIKALDRERLLNFTSEDALDELTLKIGMLAEKGKISPGWEDILAHFLKGSEIISPLY
ncbi:putative toxin-antitoxin system toxin component, PIN family [Thermococcus siculi]|uniref:putative toxin-antitoxin system toxin component, PIN family n=1 Tax=Thermococcus siculi TaxID=72803 RepID=UPI00202A9CA3|nr:putative toxin-antitoxin system toxin component, PIN family [Thermococcus siculi]